MVIADSIVHGLSANAGVLAGEPQALLGGHALGPAVEDAHGDALAARQRHRGVEVRRVVAAPGFGCAIGSMPSFGLPFRSAYVSL